MENIFGAIISIWIVCTIFFLVFLAVESDNNNISIAKYLIEFICNLFNDRNYFGIFMSIIICIILIPVYIYVLIIKIICLISRVVVHIWNLGIKK